jgi:hypothetical protein
MYTHGISFTLCFHSKQPRMATSKKGLMAMVYIRSAFILIFLSSPCQSNDQLTQTKPLLLEDTLISEGGDFALGFFSPTNSSKKLYIGIWYHRVTERTVVWVANRDNPITTPSAMLAITDNLELVLSDSQGHTLWMATGNTSGDAGGAASAVLLNSGNFVLRLPNGTEVWHSFDHPTDTILPTMRILLSFKTQPATRLIAWKGPDNPSTGDISSGMDSTNLQMFIWKGALPYYRFPVVNDMAVAGAMYQQSNGNAAIMYETRVNAGDALYYTYTVSSGSPYTRFSLDYTGKGRLLSWNSTTSSWTVIIEHPHSCDLYASCGPFSYCDQMGPLPTTCQCPDGFELLNSLNFSRGCRRKEELKCGVGNYFMAMSSMKLPDKFLHIKNRTFDQCADECTRNCSCMAYAYANLSSIGAVGDTSRCLVWSGDLIDMEKNSFSEVLYIRLGGSGTCIPNTSSFFRQR